MHDRAKPSPPLDEIARWLAGRYAAPVQDLQPLAGGFWSSAYRYRVGTEEFVLRLSDLAEGFSIDAAATRFKSPDLPIPAVVETGRALDTNFAISHRHVGRFIEELPTDEGPAAGVALARLLSVLRAVPSRPDAPVLWYDESRSKEMTWRDWLLGGLRDGSNDTVSGWRSRMASDPALDRLFRRCERRINELLPHCPERRDLVHGDLLHQNVLVAEDDASRVTAVFSWKCSVRGDFLFDVAWCTFWSPWHPAIAVADLWGRTLAAPDLRSDDLADAPLRHHCYELQIAASHLGWNVWTGNSEELAAVARETQHLLERGPRRV